jgi:hypothetical protein
MKIINCINRAWTGTLLGLVFGGFSLGVMAGPIGYLQIEGQIEVKSPGDERAVRVSDNNFTVFSGDRVRTRSGAAVLVLNGGGTLGLAPGSEAGMQQDLQDRSLKLELTDGTLFYALPAHVGNFSVVMDEFRLTSSLTDERAIQVGLDDEDAVSGRIERMPDGHIKVSVRNGQMQVEAESGSRYLVSAGNQIGLLSGATPLQVSSESPANAYIMFEAPERVGTGENFSIRWEAPEIPEDGFITIAPKDSDAETFDSMASIDHGQEIEFAAPNSPGDYEIRFIDPETGLVTNFVYLQVIGDPIVVPWYTTRTAIAGIGFVAGLTTAWLICDCDDDDPDPVSP